MDLYNAGLQDVGEVENLTVFLSKVDSILDQMADYDNNKNYYENFLNLQDCVREESQNKDSASHSDAMFHSDAILALRHVIIEQLVWNEKESKSFLPASSLSVLITWETVEHCIPNASAELIDFVCHSASRLFTILVYSTDPEDGVFKGDPLSYHEVPSNNMV